MTVLPLPVVHRPYGGLPKPATIHMSGGRDVWSSPLESAPQDPVAAVWEALNEVLDPEIPISLTELGLIYGVDVVGAPPTGTHTSPCLGCDQPCLSTCPVDAFTDAMNSPVPAS